MKIKKIFDFFYRRYLYNAVTKAWKYRYKNVNDNLFKNSLKKEYIEEYQQKWSVYGKSVELKTFLLCYNLSGIIDFNIVPENLFAAIIEKKLNPHKEISFYSIKNIYEKWFDNKSIFPKSYFHKIDGIYYDYKLEVIFNIEHYIENITLSFPIILKSSKDTFGGKDVKKIYHREELLEGIKMFENFVCQELIIQHDLLNSINDSSINSVRSCLYRTKSGTFKVINNSVRFGINGGLDNETSGGIVCNIHEDGNLNHYAVDKYAKKFFEHPNSKIKFSEIKIPYYDSLINTAEFIANQIILCKLVSLDMCLDSNNKWRCLELNVRSQTIRFAQYAGKGFFGDYTNEVLEHTSLSS